MNRSCKLLLVFAICLSAASPSHSDEISLGKNIFRVADGFRVEVIAAPPLVKYPICADFDEHGRLYVCESSGSIDWNKPQTPESMHKVLRLEDTDGDGVFDKRTVFAEFEMMPQGSMWLDGSLYVAAAPVIWKLTDTDDDGVVDLREAWVKTDKTTGCLNDLRGPYLGPDGFIYWSKGPALQEYMVDGKPWASSARHIMRRHPKSLNAEPLMVGGMDNPIEIAFTLGGQRMITCTYIQPPGQPRDDGILHAIYGGVYPKDIAPIYEFPWTGPDLLTPLTTWGAVSPAGLMCYQSTVLGSEYRGNLFSAHFNGHRVFRHQLKAKGAGFECTNEELIGCDNVDFHPTEVMEDADGSLIVIETAVGIVTAAHRRLFIVPMSTEQSIVYEEKTERRSAIRAENRLPGPMFRMKRWPNDSAISDLLFVVWQRSNLQRGANQVYRLLSRSRKRRMHPIWQNSARFGPQHALIRSEPPI